MSKLSKGDSVPNITLKDQDSNEVNLSTVKPGKALVVYFYPKDDTPGCTAQACSFRDRFEEFEDAGAVVVGISGDSVKSHKRFAQRHNLNFQLLSDPKREAEKAFGVPRNFLGLIPGRVTYVFDAHRKLIYSFSSASQATKHIREALKALEGVQSE